MGEATESKILRRLRSAGGIEVRRGTKGELLITVLGGKPIPLLLEIKHRYSDDVLDQVKALTRDPSRAAVALVVPKLSPRRREQLRAREVSWIEYTTGFVHVRAPGLAIDLSEEPSRDAGVSRPALPSLAGKAGVVVEALIGLARSRETVSQPEVAELCGSTQAWTSIVFRALVESKAMEVIGAGPRKEWRPNVERILDLWIDQGGPAPRETGMYVWARNTDHLLERIGALGSARLEYALGGVAAANLHEPTLATTPTPTVWIPVANPPEDAARQLSGEVVNSGANLTVWQAAGDPALRLAKRLGTWRVAPDDPVRELSVVSPARAAVEAIRAPGRGPEVGQRLRESIIRSAARRRNARG
jgi:hypothetical protein